MERKVAIIDYGMGNVGSIKNMLKKIGGCSVIVTNDAQEILDANKIILPGVGAFDTGMQKLNESGIDQVLLKVVGDEGKQILGICLGMQLMTLGSEEGEERGLGIFDAYTKKFVPDGDIRIPHMGWNYIRTEKENALVDSREKLRYYFVHSYYVECANEQDKLFTTSYGQRFVSGIQFQNVTGVQFHPEKSHRFGIDLMRNFLNS
jgi:glutamine amidotransferase